MQIYTIDDFRPMPWANGGGETLELFRLPHPRRQDAFALRLSVADVRQSGPFSHFAGVDRQLGLLEGAGMELALADGRVLRLDQAGQVVAFTGEIDIACRLLDGPLRDCNLMLARDWGRGELSHAACEAGEILEWEACDLSLIYLHQGRWSAEGGELPKECLLLAEQETVRLEALSAAAYWRADVTLHSAA
ncbi:HutD family protein [Chromobacterium sp. IIBBL 290-4]|uniref:HutD/Ves family protein n=1 Tax=Chromobacterium sp. IIBBL 290-4 TaxID=2953890 RepID=UPI0020B785EE|nr:HutD family protein [Chromobacterium sp. IIBBL 290-4]UTH76489.1 HutD family protein [Chromobacterium sp. IIBBL 290-4]